MAITDAEFTRWLNDDQSIRCILAEADSNVQGVETTRYFSTRGYVSSGSDTPSNTLYDGLIEDVNQFTESLDLESSASLSFGDMELANYEGELDDWFNDVWVNRKIVVLIGDVQWPKADFRVIFNGITQDIDGGSADTLRIQFRDKMERLNTPVSEEKLGGSSINSERLIPVMLGEGFNVTAMLSDEATHEYQFGIGQVEGVIEARDNGLPVPFDGDFENGKVTLTNNPFGTITFSVQGDAIDGYSNKVVDLVTKLALNYGKFSERFTLGDIDTGNFDQFTIDNPQPVGIYLSDRTNVLSVINQLADSVGAQAVMSRQGQLRLLKIDLPATGTPQVITAADMDEHSLKIEHRVSVKSAIRIGFNKNWTVMKDLQTDIKEEYKEFFAQQWISVYAYDAGVEATYRLDKAPVMKETLLLALADAQAEADRLLNFYKTPRTVFGFEGGANLIELELGSAVTLDHKRYGLSGGVNGMVIKMQIGWLDLSTRVSVIT